MPEQRAHDRGREQHQERQARLHAEAGAARRQAMGTAADSERRVAAAEQCVRFCFCFFCMDPLSVWRTASNDGKASALCLCN